ncbi:AAA family ATPase [Amycolatopsis rhabdoformis]|uniref:AAA family ATPase n=1 Tax=Amycolatopsis rhabdoformis TaxID=1448059 RepID=A0ABZ1IFA0_9PSEU|nr:AAA family ATPase [Amycolatopsis rhabdoformis]WSE32784.1 AAA family ATPase [Amycolatopsis rhabdoformis]
MIELGNRDLLVVAGLPGAGKTTMLRHAAGDLRVLDSDQVRGRLRAVLPAAVPYRLYRPVVHLCHRARIVGCAALRRGPLVVHEPATRASTRRWLAVVARMTRRPARLLWLDVSAEEALAGQHCRARIVRSRSFARHVARARLVRERLHAGRVPPGFLDARVLTRAVAQYAVLRPVAGGPTTASAPRRLRPAPRTDPPRAAATSRTARPAARGTAG